MLPRLHRSVSMRTCTMLLRGSQSASTCGPGARSQLSGERAVHAWRGTRMLGSSPSSNTSRSTREAMSPLGSFLTRQIMFNGPIPVSQYMHLCLTHPDHGYYTSRTSILGSEGDFVTAPEVSQVFGEMIAVWVAHVSKAVDAPEGYAIAELGPGRGTLMADILRSLRALDCLPKEVHFVEASTIMRNAQKSAVAQLASRNGVATRWHSTLQNVPDRGVRDASSGALPTIYIAQEFFDALPVHVFQSTPDGKWRERFVDVVREDDTASEPTPYHFRYVLSPGYSPATAVYAPRYLPDLNNPHGRDSANDTTVVELCPDGIALAEQLAHRVSTSGGAALIVDYGANERASGPRTLPSLRAIRDHKVVDVRSQPGMCDITADVNFGHIKQSVAASDAVFHGSTTQREFLLRLGAAARFRALGLAIVDNHALSNTRKDEQLAKLQADHDRLISPEQMGNAYRVCSIAHRDVNPPAFKS